MYDGRVFCEESYIASAETAEAMMGFKIRFNEVVRNAVTELPGHDLLS